MTTTEPITRPATGRPIEGATRLVPVPTGQVSLVDRTLMRLGLALLLASARHAGRREREPQQPETRHIVLGHRPTPGSRPFC